MTKKKIAIFQRDLKVGGIQKSLLTILKKIDVSKVDVDLYLFDKEIFYDEKITENINIVFLKPEKIFTKFIPFNLFKFFRKNYKINEEYDLAIDFDSYQHATALGAISVKAKKRIMWIHNNVEAKIKEEFKYKILHLFFKEKYKYFDKFIGVSKGVIEPFKKVNKLVNKDYLVIPNFIDADTIIEKSKDKSDLVINKSCYNLVSLGRLCHQKGFDILINYISEIIKNRDDIHLYLIGDGPDYKKLNKQIIENNLTNFITFLGNRTNPFKYMKEMDGFILTSRYEGQGIVILEAKVLGLEIFIPKHLEIYNDGILGRNKIVEDIINAKKTSHELDSLESYNNSTLVSLNKLFEIK